MPQAPAVRQGLTHDRAARVFGGVHGRQHAECGVHRDIAPLAKDDPASLGEDQSGGILKGAVEPLENLRFSKVHFVEKNPPAVAHGLRKIAFLKAPSSDRNLLSANQAQLFKLGELASLLRGVGQQLFGGLCEPMGFRSDVVPVDQVGAVGRHVAAHQLRCVGVTVQVKTHHGLAEQVCEVEHRRGFRRCGVAFERDGDPVKHTKSDRPECFEKRSIHAEMLKLACIRNPRGPCPVGFWIRKQQVQNAESVRRVFDWGR